MYKAIILYFNITLRKNNVRDQMGCERDKGAFFLPYFLLDYLRKLYFLFSSILAFYLYYLFFDASDYLKNYII